MKAMKFSELRDMGTEQLEVFLKEAKDSLFRLRLQARMERLDSPSELKKNKRLIARILTLQAERSKPKTETDSKKKRKKSRAKVK